MAEIILLSGQTANAVEPTAVPATCAITTVAASLLIDGETFSIWDVIRQKTIVFEFNIPVANLVISPRADAQVNLTGAETADQVRDAIIAVIMGTTGYPVGATPVPFGFSAVSGGAATVTVTQRKPGTEGNGASADTVANVGFAVTAMAAGTLSGVSLQAPSVAGGADLRAMKLWWIAIGQGAGASGAITGRFRLWLYREILYVVGAVGATSRGWVLYRGPEQNGLLVTDVNRGYLNAGAAIGEDLPADNNHYSELVTGLAAYQRAYLQLTDVGGTTPAFWAVAYADPSWQDK